MPSIVTKFQIFLASPSDLANDRLLFDEVIEELNLTFGVPNGIYLELKKWETHSAPAISEVHPQEIINTDIGDNYDLFIGLLWQKFGSKTTKADSGTEEEFLRAYERFKKDPKSIQILIYFNTKPVSPLEVDSNQIQKIVKFREDLGTNKKALYWDYQTPEELAKFLRIHIPKRILELNDNFKKRPPKKDLPSDSIVVEPKSNDFGILEYSDMIEENFQESTIVLERMSESILWIGEKLASKTNEINALTRGGVQPSRKELREIYKRTSKIFDAFGSRIKPDISTYQNYFEKGIDAYSKLIMITRIDLGVEDSELQDTKESLISLIEQIDYGISSMGEFMDAVRGFPRVSQELNKSKDNVLVLLEELFRNMNVSRNIANELLESI